jgi:hypothetical protein
MEAPAKIKHNSLLPSHQPSNAMDFETFLLHCGDDFSRQLIIQELDLEDQKNLRLVSYITNHVVLNYPIVTKLHISTHKADVDYLNVISKNMRLVKHVKTIVWNQSVHEILLLDERLCKKYMNSKFSDAEESEDTEEPEFYGQARQRWEKLARAQKSNLEQGEDYKLIAKLLPQLKNVDTVIFAADNFGEQQNYFAEVASPAKSEWYGLDCCMYVPSPCSDEWLQTSGRYFSITAGEWCKDEIVAISADKQETSSFWTRLPLRGIAFFCNSANSNGTTCLQDFFPNLSSLEVKNIQPNFLCPDDGGQELLLLLRSARNISHLQVIVSTVPDGEVWDLDGIEGLKPDLSINEIILSTASTLKHVHLGEGPTRNTFNLPVWIAADILPNLPVLASLVLSIYWPRMGLLEDLRDSIGASQSIEHVKIFTLELDQEHDLRMATRLFKKSGDLHRLKSFYMGPVSGLIGLAPSFGNFRLRGV